MNRKDKIKLWKLWKDERAIRLAYRNKINLGNGVFGDYDDDPNLGLSPRVDVTTVSEAFAGGIPLESTEK